MNVNTDPLAEDYLRRLEAAAVVLPADRRAELVAEIREHIAEALRQAPAGGEAAVRTVLDRLGPPDEIVDAATDPESPDQFAPVPELNGLAVASLAFGVLWLAGAGAPLALICGYRARRQIRNSDGGQRGYGLATAGIILGWLGIALIVLVAIIALFLKPSR